MQALKSVVLSVSRPVRCWGRFRDPCDAGGETAGHGLRGEGGAAGDEKLERKRKKEAKHKQHSFEGKGKEEAVEKRKLPSSEEDNEAQKQHHGDGEQ